MANTWLSLLPPIFVLLCGFITQNIILSLLIGIISASFIATDFAVIAGVEHSVMGIVTNTLSSWNMFICAFLFMLAIIVTLIGYSGAASAYTRTARKYIHTKRGVQASSIILSCLLFIDDYFSSLTVGSVMQPLTDQFKIPRVKLAFLVDAMSAPLAILCPFSSWVAAAIGFLQENGVSARITSETRIISDPLSAYGHILPFLMYSFIVIASAIFIIFFNISFGSMHIHEYIAEHDNNLFGGKMPAYEAAISAPPQHNKDRATMYDFLLPIAVLVISVISGMLYSGNWTLFGGDHTFIQALQNSNAATTLFLSGIITLMFCTLFFILRGSISIKKLPLLYSDGIVLMMPAIATLLLAWTLGDILRNDLKTGHYLASLIGDSVPIIFMPALFFLFALTTSFAIGSSWGTIAILMPIAIPMVISISGQTIPVQPTDIPLLFPVFGGLFSGAVAGDHISPISDTTLMSSTSTGCHHMDHVNTQINYATPIIIATLCSFILIGFLLPYGAYTAAVFGALTGIIISIILLYILNMRYTRKHIS